jgi:hypothetical protein
MTHQIYLSEDSQYIILEVEGEITRENAMVFNLEAHKLGKELALNKYLVDLTNARNVESTLNNYQFTYGDMKQEPGINLTAIAALVVAEDDHSHDFFETLAKNSGLNVTLFRDKEKAIEYLNKK